ncbi:MAG: sialidase family protein [Methylobacter sp.]|nr:sialidase family protein [Methylobacter sp.]
MKFHILFLFIAILTVTGCAKDTVIKQSEGAKKPHKQSHQAEKKGICANPATPPTSKCSETVTAAFDRKGTLWIAWVNNDHIYVQFSLDKGISFSAPVKVNPVAEPVAAQGESRPKIKLDAQGNIYLTWVLTLDKKRSTYIRFSRSSDGGKHFSDPVTVNDNLEIIRHRFDSLAIGKNGEVFIAWLDARDGEAAKKAGQDFKGLSLYYAWSDDGGKHFYPNKEIAAHTCECCRLDTAVNKTNTPVVIWRHIFEGGIRDHAIVNFKNWNTPDEITRLSHENWQIDACPHHGPGLSISDTGSYHSVWFSNSPTKQGLFYAYSKSSGKNFSEPVNFGNAGASHPHVLALGRQVNIAWREFDGNNNIIWVMKSADEGKTWTKPEALAKTAETADDPFLVSDGQKIYVSWQVQQQNFRLNPVDEIKMTQKVAHSEQ